ncbi:MAG: SCP2 sterol-binding domain-containing protein [Chloroflexi bacterium]|nr:SCP2 sterol-binding domain-containing protein [Chloroflexota bacterium]
MPFYHDSETLTGILQELFARLSHTSGATEQFSSSGLLIHVYIKQPSAFIALDGRVHPVGFSFTPDDKHPDLALYLDADILHQIWLSEIRLRDAFFSGKIKTKGSIFKAFQLSPLFRQAEALYPQLLKERGLLA